MASPQHPADQKANPDAQEVDHVEASVEQSPVDEKRAVGGPVDTAGLAVIEQQGAIPLTGERMVTGKWEYIAFLVCSIGSQGGNLRMKLLTMAFPGGIVPWGGQHMPAGTFTASIITFSMIGTYKASQWQAVNALWILGNLGYNVAVTFYQATFPSIARNLPTVLKSEQEVKQGIKTPEEHDMVDQYERSKLYNLCNITGSALVVVFYGIAIGISYAITHNKVDDGPVSKTYQVLLGYFGVLTLACTVPFFVLQKFRPGQALPEGANPLTIGPRQVWQALKSVRNLKHAILYLVAYALLQEASGTHWNMTGILQSEHIHFNPVQNASFGLLADLAGGSGTFFMLWIQKKYRFSVKTLVTYGGVMAVVPIVWGAIGTFTQKFGFHNTWEFWLLQFWNFQTAAWGSYSVTMISEVVPAPKVYLFFSLFNTVSRSTGFTGPFICSAIIKRANGNTNAAYWFLVGVGILGVAVLCCVDPKQAKIDIAHYLEREAEELYSEEQRARQAQLVEHEDATAAAIAVDKSRA